MGQLKAKQIFSWPANFFAKNINFPWWKTLFYFCEHFLPT